MRLTGFEAIEFAEKHNMRLHKRPDPTDGPVASLSVAEAEAIADDDEDLIYLDVRDNDYYEGPPSSMQPGR